MLESHSVTSKHALAGNGPSLPSLTMFVVPLSFVACSFSMADQPRKKVKLTKLTDFFSSTATSLNVTERDFQSKIGKAKIETEEDIFKFLGVRYIDPTKRKANMFASLKSPGGGQMDNGAVTPLRRLHSVR